MKQQDVFKKIGGIIKELYDQYDYLTTISDNLNDLELELFVANAHFLADHAEILRKLNLRNHPEKVVADFTEAPNATPVMPAANPYEPVMPSAIIPSKSGSMLPDTEKKALPFEVVKPIADAAPAAHIDLDPHTGGDQFSFIRQPLEPVKRELILDEADAWEGDLQADNVVANAQITAVPNPPVAPSPVKIVPPPAVVQPAEKKQAPQPEEEKTLTINERMSAMRSEQQKPTETAVTGPQISDLKAAIMLNDKLLYIKDLFNGYNLAYSEALDILNRFGTFEEADHFLQTNYATKNHWAEKQATTDKFYALLRRRYGS
jgi:hypothetical protein